MIFLIVTYIYFRRRRLHTFTYGSLSLLAGALLAIGNFNKCEKKTTKIVVCQQQANIIQIFKTSKLTL